MKYEAVFGNQELFDGAGTFTGLDVVTRNVDTDLYSFCRYKDLTNDYLRVNPVVAMRRIIAEPKRWTVEDKKAGRLPEVGCRIYVPIMHEEQNVIYSSEKVIVSISDNEGAVTRTEVGSIDRIKPIESPEEKAARLREEWKNNVIEIHHGKRRKMSTSTFLLDDIYDALLSGELQAPTKGE